MANLRSFPIFTGHPRWGGLYFIGDEIQAARKRTENKREEPVEVPSRIAARKKGPADDLLRSR
jgi:hypothetical protein